MDKVGEQRKANIRKRMSLEKEEQAAKSSPKRSRARTGPVATTRKPSTTR